MCILSGFKVGLWESGTEMTSSRKWSTMTGEIGTMKKRHNECIWFEVGEPYNLFFTYCRQMRDTPLFLHGTSIDSCYS
jgi:hypothetical protein